MRTTTASAVLALCLFAASAAWAESPLVCPGGRLLTGFHLVAQPLAGGEALPLQAVNDLGPGDALQYAPYQLPQAWRHSARVAVLLVPATDDANAELRVYTQPADKSVSWNIPAAVGAVAFLFGPDGFDAKQSRTLLANHPELIAHFVQYATETARVEALVALLADYEQSSPGTLNLDTMLKAYAAEYDVKVPTADPTLSPQDEAATLLAAVAPPTAQADPSGHAELESGSTSTAASLASLYFGPEVGIAYDTVPLFRALHQSMFPGIQFQGAFGQPAGTNDMSMCVADTGAPAQKHPVYIWMVAIPGGAPPAVRLLKTPSVDIPVAAKSTVAVTCASVAQLHQLLRARAWKLVSAVHSAAVPVTVSASAASDTLALDLTNVKLPPGSYQLATLWDWTPVTVQGMVNVRPIPDLAKVTMEPGDADRLISGQGLVSVDLSGVDLSFVDKVEMISKGAAAAITGPGLAFTPAPAPGKPLEVKLNLAKLAPGAYDLRLYQVNGAAPQVVPLTVHPPNPSLGQLPLVANVGEKSQTLTLHGEHLELIQRLASPEAAWSLDPIPNGALGLTERTATLTLAAQAKPGQDMPVSLYVAGLDAPLVLSNALHVLGPRPEILNVTEPPALGGTVALRAGELPAAAVANVAFALKHAGAAPAIRLGCQYQDDDQDELARTVTLHPGESSGDQELDSSGDGLYYLAVQPGQIGDPGCELEMTAIAAEGASEPYKLGRVVQLPQIDKFTLSDQSAGPGMFSGELTGENLQLIAKTGWSLDLGVPVTAIPERVSIKPPVQTLAVVLPWPPPAPHAPLFIWLRGERHARQTTVAP